MSPSMINLSRLASTTIFHDWFKILIHASIDKPILLFYSVVSKTKA